jgi:uncharacterized protein YkwD
VVSNYWPAGNFTNEFVDNVAPPIRINSLISGQPPKKELKPNLQTSSSSSFKPIRETRDTKLDLNNNYLNDSSNSGSEKFILEALSAHNEHRKTHGCEPLILNQDLNKIAQTYADYLAQINALTHSSNTYRGQSLGENLVYFYDSKLNYYPGKIATAQWYNEIKDHNFGKDNQKGTGHFTQVRIFTHFYVFERKFFYLNLKNSSLFGSRAKK